MLHKNDFLLDTATNVWVPREGVREFRYQDGDESRLLAKISGCTDRSTYSQEFYPYLSWSQEYHLSPLRGNILAAIDEKLRPGSRVLELGAGCGAITRALGEKGCDVDAVEGSMERAVIAAARCSDLPNVRVYCTNFNRMDLGVGAYDIVTLIGVLEYAALFIDHPQPFNAALLRASDCLTKEGFLFIAIENQLGLKYFNGMREDHVGFAFYGIQGMYQSGRKTAETFTKKGLTGLLTRAGLPEQQFFYPYPDYKLPTAVLAEGAFADDRLSAFQIVSHCKSRDYSAVHTPLFYEPSVLRTLTQAGVADHFANSFAVVASRIPLSTPPWVAQIFANRRKPEFCVQTTIQNAQGVLRVTKRALSARDDNGGRTAALVDHSVMADEAFLEGRLLSAELAETLYLPTIDCLPELRRLLLQWLDFLKANADNDQSLDGSFYDAIPGNLMLVGGALKYFDAEWRVQGRIPMLLPFFRGIVSTFGGVTDEVWLSKIPHSSLHDLCLDILSRGGVTCTKREISNCIELDAQVHESIDPKVTRLQYARSLARVYLGDLRWSRFRRSVKAFIGSGRRLVRQIPIVGDALSSLLRAVAKR
jgi:hypothetical protein